MTILISRFLLQLQEASQATIRVLTDDPLRISANFYDETPSFIRSLRSDVDAALPRMADCDEDESVPDLHAGADGELEREMGQV